MSESKYKTEALGAIHETMDGLCRLGVIAEEDMKHFDKACLVMPFKETTDRNWWREVFRVHEMFVKQMLQDTQNKWQSFMKNLHIVEKSPSEEMRKKGYVSEWKCLTKTPDNQ